MHPIRLRSALQAAGAAASLAAAASWGASALGAEAACPGLRVREVRSKSPAAEAGVRAGDVLRGWRFADPVTAGELEPQGPVCTFFDIYRLTLELRPRGQVELRWERDGKLLPFGSDELSGAPLEPALAGELAQLWTAAKPLRTSTDPEAVNAWDRLYAAAERLAGVPFRAWLLVDRGYAITTHRDGDPEAGAALMAGAHELAAPEHPWIAAHIQRSRGHALGHRDPASVPWLEAARDGWLAIGEELSAAHATDLLGTGKLVRFELEEARDHLLEVAAVRARLAPGSWFEASANGNLGALYFHLGDRVEAAARMERTLEILAGSPPIRLQADTYGNLAGVYGMLGETGKQVAAATESLRLVRLLELGSGSESSTLINLAGAYVNLGDLARAEAVAREALEPAATLRDTERLAVVHQMIGSIAEQRGDLEAAERSHRTAIEIHQEAGTVSPELALAALSLGQVLTLRGELDSADREFERAARHLEEHAPGHYSAIALDSTWAELLLRKSRPVQALAKADAAIATAREQSTGGQLLFTARLARGRALAALGQLDEAGREAERCLELAGGYAPGTIDEARALGLAGRVAARGGNWRQAADAYCRGADLLERQIDRLGGVADTAARFRSRYLGLFEGCAEARLALGDAAAAFHVLERSRAWRIRRALAERGIVPGAGSGDLTVRFRQLAAEHDRTLEELAAAPDDQASGRLRDRLSELGLEREALWAEARAADPRLAALAYPTPRTVAQIARELSSGELLVVFEVTEDATLAVAVEPSGQARGRRLPLGEDELHQRVDRLLAAVGRRSAGDEPPAEAEALWERLLAPVVTGGPLPRRLIVSADGSLLRLPWSALGREGGDGSWRWAVEDLAVTVIPSATVWSELLARPPTRADRVAAFGDPAFGDGSADDGDPLRSLLELRGTLEPLPGTRDEVAALTETLAPRPFDVYLGAAASETNARRLGPRQSIIHFASHALVDEVRPLESGLVLATPETPDAGVDNGFLQAWEIIDGLRLDADLVTLSACSTARGAELAGEGSLDLASAFLHAGARSVVASLWPVSDRSTAALMKRFYRELAAGTPRDEALRRAQVALLRGAVAGGPGGDESPAERGVGGLAPRPDPGAEPATAAPFYWAAFRLVGDPG